ITLIVAGSQENQRIITHREDHSPTAPGKVRMGFANTLDTVPRVRVESPGGSIPGISDIIYGQSIPEITLDAETTSFYWKSVENNIALEDFAEVAEFVELAAGHSYLYLFTGRLDDPPLIFGEVVGIDEQLAEIDPNLVGTPTPTVPTKIRFVNAIETGLLVEFHLDDSPVTDPMALKAGSPLSQTTLGDHVATVHNAANGALLGRLEFRIEIPGSYSVFSYGNEVTTQIDLLLVPDVDLNFDNESSHLRLINLSQDAYTVFGLAYSTPLSEPLFLPTTPIPGEESNQTFRRPIPIGINRLLSDVITGSFSTTARANPGEQSIMVLDDQETAIAATVPSIDLENGVHYDVVSFQRIGSPEVQVFMLPYPNE
ncbi:MAG: DUF4397 domain-containing protein, partial [Anaerolineae bacterium]|nr:DUF4397 domain-containing protein [Anaerolineae bacterium]